MKLNVARAIDRFAVDLTLYPAQPVSYDLDGKPVVAVSVGQTFRGTIQAADMRSQTGDGNRLHDEREGVYVEAQWVLWTRTDVALEDVVETSADVRYRVARIWPRDEGGYTRASLGMLR